MVGPAAGSPALGFHRNARERVYVHACMCGCVHACVRTVFVTDGEGQWGLHLLETCQSGALC